MRESLGTTALFNFIVVFIVVIFGLIAGVVNYYKAFKVNSVITNAIEKYEGYNSLSAIEIDRSLSNLGYLKLNTGNCPKKNGKNAMANLTSTYNYCIYEFESPSRDGYYSYGVMTYMYVDVPLLNDTFKIPVYSKTDTYYRFHIQ